jgi:energy-coupling factor transport system substrate-specific component
MKLNIKEIELFGMLGALMFASKLITEILPNIHLIGVFTVAFTVVFGKKALYPIYTFVLISGVFYGFASWWVAYLYIWALLWAITMIIPKNLPKKIQLPVFMTVCGLHGLLYGVFYAPAQALLFGLDFNGTLAWIIAGLPFDAIHGVSNFLCGMLILPIVKALKSAQKHI